MIYIPMTNEHWESLPDEARPRRCEDTKGITAIGSDGKTQAVCVFDSWTENSCQIHIHIANPFVLKHGFAEEVFNYVFSEDSGREVVIGVTPENNRQALKFIKHIGFSEVARIPDGHERGVDYVVTTMRKEDCIWLKRLDATGVS